MGAHKYNPTAIAAKNGELPPKPPKMSKREWERIVDAKCRELLYRPLIPEAVFIERKMYCVPSRRSKGGEKE